MPFVDARYHDHVEASAEASKWREKGHTAQVRKAAVTPAEAKQGINQVWVIEISAQPKEEPRVKTEEETLREAELREERRAGRVAQASRAEEAQRIQRERLELARTAQFERMARAASGLGTERKRKRKLMVTEETKKLAKEAHGLGSFSGGVRATKARKRLKQVSGKFGAGKKPGIASPSKGMPRIAQAPSSRPRIAQSGLGTGVNKPVIAREFDLSKLRW